MSATNKPLKTDLGGKPINQHYNPVADEHQPTEGANGAPNTRIKDGENEAFGARNDSPATAHNQTATLISLLKYMLQLLDSPWAKGDKGDKGDTGEALTPKGVVPDSASLPISGNTENDFWITSDDGHGWVWDGSQWIDVGQIQGDPGADGREVELQKSATHIQWRYVGEVGWVNLVTLSELKGDQGDPGNSAEFQVTATHIQWRLQGAPTWTDLIALSELEGEKGDAGDEVELRVDSGFIQWRLTGGAWANLIEVATLKGDKGDTGEVRATVSETPPVSPVNGQLWYNSALGVLLSWYEDGDSGQWVEVGGTPPASPVQSVNTQTGDVVLGAGDVGAIPASEKGAADGVATLGADGYVPSDESYPMGDIAPLFESHLFYAPMSSAVLSVQLATVYYHFLRINADVPIDRIYVRCTNTGGGDGEVRMGIYGPATPPLKTTGGLPLIVDTGILPINATGLIGATIDVTLQRGWYMIAMSNKRATGTDWQSPTFIGGTSPTVYSSPSWIHLVAIPQALYGGVQSETTIPSQPLTNPSPSINMLADVPPVTAIPVVYFRRKVT